MTTYDYNTSMTLPEIVNRQDPKGNSAVIVEVLHQTNAILQDAIWKEANGDSYHKVIRRASLGSGVSGVRRFNEGTVKSNSTTRNYTVGLAMFEKRSEVDVDMVNIHSSPKEFRSSEGKALMEEMGQDFASYIIYGDDSDGELGFRGLANELGTLADARVFNNGGTGSDLTSAYMVQWGESKTYCVYPKGMANSGVEHKDLGEQLVVEDNDATNTKKLRVYIDIFKMNGALVIADPRSVARVCNIEVTGDATDPATSKTIDPANIIYALSNMVNQLGGSDMGAGTVLYVPRVIFAQLAIYANSNPGKGFYYANPFNSSDKSSHFSILTYQGVPIRLTEQILTTESAVV